MKHITRWMPACLAGLTLAAACDTAPTAAPIAASTASTVAAAAAEREVEEFLYTFDGSYTAFSCGEDGEPLGDGEGELVALQGQIYEKYTTTRDAMDGYHFTLQAIPVGLVGIGETSGEVFRVVEQGHAAYNQTMTGFSGSWRYEYKLTGTETRRTFWLVSTGNYRILFEGGAVVDRSELTTVCRPARG